MIVVYDLLLIDSFFHVGRTKKRPESKFRIANHRFDSEPELFSPCTQQPVCMPS